jgi:hypothetical protein
MQLPFQLGSCLYVRFQCLAFFGAKLAILQHLSVSYIRIVLCHVLFPPSR